MPYIHVANAGKLDNQQKKALFEKMTAAICEVTGKPASSVYMRIDEVARDNFGVGGVALAEKDQTQT